MGYLRENLFCSSFVSRQQHLGSLWQSTCQALPEENLIVRNPAFLKLLEKDFIVGFTLGKQSFSFRAGESR